MRNTHEKLCNFLVTTGKNNIIMPIGQKSNCFEPARSMVSFLSMMFGFTSNDSSYKNIIVKIRQSMVSFDTILKLELHLQGKMVTGIFTIISILIMGNAKWDTISL